MEHAFSDALLPVVTLLALGVVAAIGSREVGLSPVVGYLALGIVLNASGVAGSGATVALLAELGVVFLLFDIGLHFSFGTIRAHAGDIFGFGPVQVVFGALALGALGLAGGLAPAAAALVGATLALSSTAVVARIIAEKHQQSCPVGLTATAILVFQDVAAIFLLIVASALGSGAAMLSATALAVAKAAAAFGVAVLLTRYVVRPVFDLIARSRNEEVFTAMALLVALSAALATSAVGLSLTLGGFLGGMMLSETPYRAIIQSEIKPFRGLLLGFFFISVGLALDLSALARAWPVAIALAGVLLVAKIISNAAASLVFRWSVPGSTQLGFLLAQGSEFAFVIFSLPAVRALIGEDRSAVLIAAVALTIAVTPNLADLGRSLAGRLRRHRLIDLDPELQPREMSGPVFIAGMGLVGRAVADALTEFEIDYAALESDPRRSREANADGYKVAFGDIGDPRIWEPVAMEGRRISVLTEPSIEVSARMTPIAERFFPDLLRVAVVGTPAEAARFARIGLLPIVDSGAPPGVDVAAEILVRLGLDADKVNAWALRRRNSVRVVAAAEPALAT